MQKKSRNLVAICGLLWYHICEVILMSQDIRTVHIPGMMYATLQQYAKKRDLTMKAALCQAIRLLTTGKKFQS